MVESRQVDSKPRTRPYYFILFCVRWESRNLNAAQLDVTSRLTEKGALVEAVGEVDLTTASLLREPLMEAVDSSEKLPVIVDLSRVDFIDSAGLALLVEARKRLAPEGRTLHILLTQGRQPERVLRPAWRAAALAVLLARRRARSSAQPASGPGRESIEPLHPGASLSRSLRSKNLCGQRFPARTDSRDRRLAADPG